MLNKYSLTTNIYGFYVLVDKLIKELKFVSFLY